MFIEDERITLKTGSRFKILAVNFKDMTVYTQSEINSVSDSYMRTFSWDDIKVEESRAIAIKEYKRRRKIDDLLK